MELTVVPQIFNSLSNSTVLTMKSVLVFVSVSLAVVMAARIRRDDEKYTSKFDNVDVDQILKSERLIKNYINCLLDKGNCSPDGAELKRLLPDALVTKCSKCNEKQQKTSEKVIRHLIEHNPDAFKELEAKYDPDGVYRKSYEEEAKERGIVLP